MGHLAGLGSAHLVEGLIHVAYDVKAVDDVERPGTLPPGDAEIMLPHVRADELDFRAELWSEHNEESLEGFDGSLFADPEQASEAGGIW